MKILTLIVSLFLLLNSSPIYAEELNLKDEDKQKHMAACFIITTGSYYVYRNLDFSKKQSLILAISTSLLVGLAKEATDDKFSSADLAADAIGATGGLIIPLTFEF